MADGSTFDPLDPVHGWNAERLARLRFLWLDIGLSASQVARDLKGITRNAVIGKVHRQGWTRPATIKQQNTARANRDKAHTQARRQPGTPNVRRPKTGQDSNAFAHRLVMKLARKAEEVQTPAPPEGTPGLRTTLTVQHGECRWPMTGSGADTTLCGENTLPEKPYCAAHQAKSRNRVQPKAINAGWLSRRVA